MDYIDRKILLAIARERGVEGSVSMVDSIGYHVGYRWFLKPSAAFLAIMWLPGKAYRDSWGNIVGGQYIV